jgi:hypothetical protein
MIFLGLSLLLQPAFASGSVQGIQTAQPRASFDEALRDVFARPEAYRWVWTTPYEDNTVVALFETLERAWIPSPLARVMAYAAASPKTPAALEPYDALVPIERSLVVVARAVGIECLASLEVPQPAYPLGALPPVTPCRAVQRYAQADSVPPSADP